MHPRSRPVRLWTLLAVAASALAAGCAHPPPLPKYVAASSGPRAQLVMRGNVQPGEAYGVYLFQDPQNCTGLQQVGIGIANRDPESTSIPTGLHTAEVFMTKPNRSICRVRWSFEPVAGHRYVVSTSSTPTGCRARILDATDPNKIVPEASSRRRDVGGKLCVPMAQTTTIADLESRARSASEADLPINVAPAPAPSTTQTTQGAADRLRVVSEDDLASLKGK